MTLTRRTRSRRGRVSVLLLAATCLLSALAGSGAQADNPNIDPTEPVIGRGDQFVPRAPGTRENLRFYYGPYEVPPGWDANRVDLTLPMRNGMVVSVEPGMRRVADGSEPSHQEGHIHHAHWFSLNPGSETDNYTYGLTDWFFGNGDEETKADFTQRSAAQPRGPIYGGHIGPHEPQPMIYMLHNKTAAPMEVWIMLEVTFIHGTLEQLNARGRRPYHEVTGVLFGRTFDVKRNRASRDGTFETPEDDRRGVIEWTSPISGTLIGTGSHLHPGGLRVITENYGSRRRPCPDAGGGYGGTVLLKSDALWRKRVRFSEDFQMEVTHPAFRAPIRKGDRIRIAGIYENRHHGWYDVMTHQGLYIDERQKPKGRCRPYLVGRAARRGLDVTAGVPNRSWGHHPTDTVCGRRYGARRCDLPEGPRQPGVPTDQVTIANFLYQPGNQGSGPAQVSQGTSLRFLNLDQLAGIRHSVTTCRWPCNGPYVANYPLPNGVWDSGTLGYDPIDGGSANPIAQTPASLPAGRYAYFCRIHPWMRGAFQVVPR